MEWSGVHHKAVQPVLPNFIFALQATSGLAVGLVVGKASEHGDPDLKDQICGHIPSQACQWAPNEHC